MTPLAPGRFRTDSGIAPSGRPELVRNGVIPENHRHRVTPCGSRDLPIMCYWQLNKLQLPTFSNGERGSSRALRISRTHPWRARLLPSHPFALHPPLESEAPAEPPLRLAPTLGERGSCRATPSPCT